MSRSLPALLTLAAIAALTLPAPAHGQLGNLVKKRLPKGATADQAGSQPQFNDVTLEITVERIDKLLAAKQAAKVLADSPNGPAALRARMDAIDSRQAAIYDKNVDRINAWDQHRRDVENCRDSSYSAIQDTKRSGPPDLQRMQQVGLAMGQAQAKGDTAEVRRLLEQLQKGREPTAAESVAVIKRCGDPTPPAVVKEWMGLKDQVEGLQKQISQSEADIEKKEADLSGMNGRQVAVSCERIKMFIEQLKKKQAWAGFSDREIEAMKKREQAIKDLSELCP